MQNCFQLTITIMAVLMAVACKGDERPAAVKAEPIATQARAASDAAVDSSPSFLKISILDADALRIGDEILFGDEIDRALAEAYRKDNATSIALETALDVDHEQVIRAIDRLKRAGFLDVYLSVRYQPLDGTPDATVAEESASEEHQSPLEGITQVSATEIRVTREAFDRIIASPTLWATGGRIIPMRSGKGVRLAGIRPTSIYAKLGMKNGDVVRSINKIPIHVKNVMETLAKVASEEGTPIVGTDSVCTIALTRKGKPMEVQIWVELLL